MQCSVCHSDTQSGLFRNMETQFVDDAFAVLMKYNLFPLLNNDDTFAPIPFLCVTCLNCTTIGLNLIMLTILIFICVLTKYNKI